MTEPTSAAPLTRAEFLKYLRGKGRCGAAALWIYQRSRLTPAELWEQCDRVHWMNWLVACTPIELPLRFTPDGLRAVVAWAEIEAHIQASIDCRRGGL